jgi:succinate-acetate transporter protein
MSAVTEQAVSATPRSEVVQTSIFLQPIAAPTVLGYFAGASGFLLFGVWLAGELGGAKGAAVLFPFLLLFSGIGQFSAGLWSYRARDAVGASLFGVWGGFWIAYGFLWLLDVTHRISLPLFAHGFAPMGQWFIYMAVITWTTAFAALARSPFQFLSQAIAGAATTIACAALIAGSAEWEHAAGWVFVAASALFMYHGTAYMLNALFGQVVLPHFSWRRAENALGQEPLQPIEVPDAEPGVKVGQ